MGPGRIDRIRPDTGRRAGRCADGVRVRCGRIPLPVRDGDPGGRGVQGLPRLRQRRRDGHDRFSGLARAGPYVRSRGVLLLRPVRPVGSRPLGYDPPDRVQPIDHPLHLPRLADSRRPFHRLCRGGGCGPGRRAGLRRGPLGYEDHRAGSVPRPWGGGVSTDRPMARLPVPFRPVADQRPVEVVQPAPRRTCGTRGAGIGVLHRRELGGGRRGCIPFVPVPAGRGRHRPRRYRRAPGNPSLRPPLADVAARVEGGLVRGGSPGGKARHRKWTGGPVGSASFDPAPLAGLFVTRKF